jgi:hypothetical protein
MYGMIILKEILKKWVGKGGGHGLDLSDSVRRNK